MNAAPDVQQRLLDLQDVDSAIDRLAQRRRTLPELAEIERLETRIAELSDEVVRAETELSDISREQRKVENDVDVVVTRVTRDQQRLDTGAVTSPKELENLQHELLSLAKRKSDLEDVVLERMEVREGVESRLAALNTELSQARADLLANEQRRDETFAEIDDESATHVSARVKLAEELAGPLLDLYEKVRASSGGTGAARLNRGRCEGCHLQLSPIDLDHMKKAPDDEVFRCEECRRILVRPPAGAE